MGNNVFKFGHFKNNVLTYEQVEFSRWSKLVLVFAFYSSVAILIFNVAWSLEMEKVSWLSRNLILYKQSQLFLLAVSKVASDKLL